MKTLNILTCGTYYRPQSTAQGGAGWVGEITFWYSKHYDDSLKHDPIRQVFDNKKDAEKFVSHELAKLKDGTYRIKKYAPDGKFQNLF